MTRQEAMRKIAKAAVKCEQRYNIPAELVAAQCALESGWLQYAPGNNPFGIKWSRSRHGENARQLLRTSEYMTEKQANEWVSRKPGRQIVEVVSGPDADGRRWMVVKDWFAVYKSLDEAFDDYCRLLSRSPRYQKILSADNWEEAIQAVGESEYATDPNYSNKLRAVMTPEFQNVINEVRAA